MSLSASSTAVVKPDLPPSMVERMTLILDEFTDRHVRLTLEEVARRTHLPRSTAHRILDQLLKLSWIEHTPSGYALGQRALRLGGGDDHGHSELRAAAAPRLHELTLRTGLVVHLAVLDGASVRYLDKMGGRFAMAVPSRVGGVMPAHGTALGLAMLAWKEPEEVDVLMSSDFSARSEGHATTVERLHAELHRVRQRGGLAFERGSWVPGISCVASAVWGPDGPAAAVSFVGDLATPLERVAPLLVQACRDISTELYGHRATGPRSTRRRTGPSRAVAASMVSAV